ncbi:hypothetical protein, partial [Hominenteromicrobium sp.]|uniref:hypothetical protein n=1 Tax=Hominenteromicrobium sp. TaxID=3073581 RepID=UPI003A94C028
LGNPKKAYYGQRGLLGHFLCSIHNVVMKYISVKSNVNRRIEKRTRKPEFCAFTLIPLPTKG